MSRLRAFLAAAWRVRLWWLTPLVLALVLVATLLLMTSGDADVHFRYPRF